jgi:hypothetical protein
VAILVAMRATGLTVVQRSRKGSGYDYGLGAAHDLTIHARLEVSGLLRGSPTQVQARVNQKLRQTTRSDHNQGELPAYAVIVEFSNPRAVLRVRRAASSNPPPSGHQP